MMKQGVEAWIVIPKPLPIFPRLMPKLGAPIRAKKYQQKMKNKTFYLVSVKDPEDGRWKITGRKRFCEDAIGRTVFLTEAEAKKALREME